MVKRLTPTKETMSLLFALSGNECAFPECRQKLFNDKNKFIGQVCHIAAASDGGERANINMTPEERRQQQNLLVLCYAHHVETDDVNEFPAHRLIEMKKDHESKYRGWIKSEDISVSGIDDMYNKERRRMQEQVSETLENTKQLLKNDEKGFSESAEVLKGLASLTASMELIKSATVTSFSAEIDDIMRLRLSKQQDSAILALQRLRDNSWPQLTAHEKYRVLANMGILSLELDQQDRAGDLFMEAFSHENNTIKSLGIGALGYIIKKDRQNAEACINKAWKIDPLNSDSWYAYIMLNKEAMAFSELVDKVPEEVRRDAEVANGLAQSAAFHGLHAEAVKWSQISFDTSPVNTFDSKAVLATSILQSQTNAYQVLSEQVSEDTKVRIGYVIQLFTEAWQEVKNTPLAKSRAWWLINRGVANKFLPDREAAYQDMLESCQHNENYEALRHLSIAAMDAGKIDKAIDAADKMIALAEESKQQEAELFKIELISKKGDHLNARELLENYLKRSLDDANRYHAILRLIGTHVILKDISAAKLLNENALAIFPDKVRLYVNNARFASNKDDFKIALKKALSVVSDETEPTEIYELVYWLQKAGDFENAAVLLRKITNINSLSAYTRELLEIYHNNGDRDKLLDLTESLLEIYGPVDFLTEYRVIVYQQIGNYGIAINTCLDYLKIYPDDQRILIRLGILYEKDGRPEDLKDLLSTITHVDSELPFELQLNMARLYFAAEAYDRYYQILYDVRRQHFDNAEVHKSYVNLMLKRKDPNGGISTDEVLTDRAVSVKLPGGKIETFIIEDRKDSKEVKGEINLRDPITKALLGARVGDSIKIELPSGTTIFEVVEITSKYAFAVRESLNLLTGKLLRSSNIKTLEFGTAGDSVEKVNPLNQIFDEFESAHRIFAYHYREGRLSLGFIAAANGMPVLDVYDNYVLEDGSGLINQTFLVEHQNAIQGLYAKKPLVLDLISLNTIAKTNTYQEIDLLENGLYVLQSSVNEITQQISRLREIEHSGIVKLRNVEGKKTSTYVSAGEVKKQIGDLQNLAEWVKSKCTILPATAAIKINLNDKAEMDNDFGEPFIDSILTAEDLGAMLVAEEQLVRAFASHRFNIQGANLYSILSFLELQKLISDERKEEVSLALIQLGYKFIPVTADLLFKLLNSNDFQIGAQFEKASFGINSTLIPGDLALKIAVDLFYKLYTEASGIISALSDLRQRLIVEQMLNVLKMKFREKELKYRLVDLVYTKFKLLPFQYDKLKQMIDEYLIG